MYQKNHFRDPHTLLCSIFFLNLTAIVRYGNLILVKVPQIVTYILQKAFFKHALTDKQYCINLRNKRKN